MIPHEEPRLINGKPEGMVEYEVRTGIRDLCRIYGKEHAREIVAMIVNDEMKGQRQ